ncbi:MAG TPA: hypothetical protein VNO84_11015 [Burkholderiaceae bacterium]|nr:hypothetical protein [Burkholderiaceae bacterium]
MKAIKILGLVLVVAGVLGLVYPSFRYTKDQHDVQLGPLQFSVKEEETVNVPIWAGIGAIAVGVVLLLAGNKKG